eukprot:m51a1_g13735 hypothetical protein (121) ;mRNA; f:152534-153021
MNSDMSDNGNTELRLRDDELLNSDNLPRLQPLQPSSLPLLRVPDDCTHASDCPCCDFCRCGSTRGERMSRCVVCSRQSCRSCVFAGSMYKRMSGYKCLGCIGKPSAHGGSSSQHSLGVFW